MLKTIKGFINNLPYIRRLLRENKALKKNSKFPAGYFYSPIVSFEDLKQKENIIWELGDVNELIGISMNLEVQKQ